MSAITPLQLDDLLAESDAAAMAYRIAKARYDAALLALVRAQCRAEVSRTPIGSGRVNIKSCMRPKGHEGEHRHYPEPTDSEEAHRWLAGQTSA